MKQEPNNEVITISTAAFYQLIDTLLKYVDDKYGNKEEEWIDTATALKLLGVRSATSLQKYRDEGRIAYSQRNGKNILYSRSSINAFIEANIKETF